MKRGLSTRLVTLTTLMSLAACEHTSQSRISPELRQEARIRRAECDTLERSIAPSRNRSGNISILGQGIGLRDATVSNNSASDQYLIGILNLITQCRRWQRFDIGAQEYRRAQSTLAAAVTSAVDAEAVDGTLNRLAEAIANAHNENEARTAELRDSFREWSQRPLGPASLDPGLAARLTRIEELVSQRPSPSTVPVMASVMEWRVGFSRASSEPDASVADAISGFERWSRGCTNGSVSIIGFADQTGSDRHNLELGRARANAVYQRLSPPAVIDPVVSSAGRTDRFGAALEANRIVVVRAVCAAR